MLHNDNVSMSIGHLDHVLIVYSSIEHVTWKSPGPMCGWVGWDPASWFMHIDVFLIHSACLSIWSVGVPLCRPLLLCPSRWHGFLPLHGWLVSYAALRCPGGSGLFTSCERVHFFVVFLDPQTKLPACLSSIWAGAVLARATIDQFGFFFILDLVIWMNYKVL